MHSLKVAESAQYASSGIGTDYGISLSPQRDHMIAAIWLLACAWCKLKSQECFRTFKVKHMHAVDARRLWLLRLTKSQLP